MTIRGSAADFARPIEACESVGPYCLIDDMAVNCYVEPVYTLDADIVVIAAGLPKLATYLRAQGFKIQEHPHSMNVQAPGSDLRIQFNTDDRYQAFLARAVDSELLGARVKIASLFDVTQGKLCSYSDPQRRLSKRKKDELDLIRLAEAHPELKSKLPPELREQIERG